MAKALTSSRCYSFCIVKYTVRLNVVWSKCLGAILSQALQKMNLLVCETKSELMHSKRGIYACLSVCLSVCVFFSFSVLCLSLCLSVSPSVCISICRSLSDFVIITLSVCYYVWESLLTPVSSSLPVCLFTCFCFSLSSFL